MMERVANQRRKIWAPGIHKRFFMFWGHIARNRVPETGIRPPPTPPKPGHPEEATEGRRRALGLSGGLPGNGEKPVQGGQGFPEGPRGLSPPRGKGAASPLSGRPEWVSVARRSREGIGAALSDQSKLNRRAK